MDSFKIDIFEKETQRKFPPYKTLTMEDSNIVLRELSSHCHSDVSDFNKIQTASELVKDIDATSEDFHVIRLFADTQPPNEIIVIWSNESAIDIFNYTDFCNCFEYIWYPSSDDILITSDIGNVMYLIRHDGVIFRIIPQG